MGEIQKAMNMLNATIMGSMLAVGDAMGKSKTPAPKSSGTPKEGEAAAAPSEGFEAAATTPSDYMGAIPRAISYEQDMAATATQFAQDAIQTKYDLKFDRAKRLRKVGAKHE